MSERIGWDQYEVALLIDYCEKVNSGTLSRPQAIKDLSAGLRARAVSRGVTIDEKFRNENGISMQMACMMFLLTDGKKGMQKKSIPFESMVSLKKADPNQYELILHEAYTQLSGSHKPVENACLITKLVDKSLLRAGLTIPKTSVEPLCNALSVSLGKGENSDVVILINNETYTAKLTNVNFSEKYASATTFQIRYSAGSPICKKINEIFSYTAALINSGAKPDSKEYIEVFPRENNRLEFVCHSQNPTIIQRENIHMINHKTGFASWLLQQKRIKGTPNSVISATEEASEYALKHGVTKTSFWSMDDHLIYLQTIRKLLGMRLFRVMHRNAALYLDKVYTYYADYLKNHQATAPQDVTAIEHGKNDASHETPTSAPTAESSEKQSLVTLPSTNEDDVLNKFSTWLLDEKKMASASARGYASSLKSINSYCIQNGIISTSFILCSADSIVLNTESILKNDTFQIYNEGQHNRFSAAIKKFFEYITGTEYGAEKSKRESKKRKNDNNEYANQIINVLVNHFVYGFRLDSPIEIRRFRRHAENDSIDLPEADDVLISGIKNIGTKIEDKVFYFTEDTLSYIKNAIKQMSSDGSTILFYECVYEFDVAGMEERYITSADFLKQLLKQCKTSIFEDLSEINFAKNFLSLAGSYMERDAVTNEIKRVWGESQTCSVDDLSSRLPAIPTEYVRRYLAGSTAFVWVSEGVYFGMDRFVMTPEEEDTALNFVLLECESKGYASISDVPLGNTAEENYELSSVGLQEAIYNRVLCGQFKLNGKILTKDASNLDVVTLAKQYLLDKEDCTFDELDEKVTELAGNRYRYMTYEALYDTMVRVDRDRYVAPKYVKFDVDAIDQVLTDMVKDRFVAIKEITSFAMFPMCGQPWNHYLLESFCHLYSKKYTLKVLGYNDKNAGIIAEQSVSSEYGELLAYSAARAKIDLTSESVGKFFFENGYMGKSKFAWLDSVVERAKTIREDL